MLELLLIEQGTCLRVSPQGIEHNLGFFTEETSCGPQSIMASQPSNSHLNNLKSASAN